MMRFPSVRKVGWMLAIAFVLLVPAIRNHYPLLYSDSGEYLLSALTRRPPRVRTVGYGLWIWLTGGTLTLWAPIIAQALLLAALLVRTVIALGLTAGPRTMLPLAAALLLTGAPWMASEAMPDVFAGAVLLALYLALAHWPHMGAATRALVCFTLVLGVATHVTMPVVVAAILVVVAIATRTRRLALPPLRTIAAAAALVALSVAALAAFNWARTSRVALTRKPSVFVVGHLVESGLAARVLADRCAVEAFALCPYQAGLTQPIDAFIWDDSSVFYKAYHDEDALRADTRNLVRAVILHEPLALLGSIVSYGARQFITIDVFDPARSRAANRFTGSVIGFVLPHEEATMLAARQQADGGTRLRWLDPVFLGVLVVSLVVSAWQLYRAFQRGPVVLASAEGLQLFIWVALAINALICANLSGVFGRYQGRLAWLLPVVVAVTFAARFPTGAERGPPHGE